MKFKKFMSEIEDNISAIMLFIMLVVLFEQVVSRWLGHSNSWSEEMSRYMFVWIVYLGGASAVKTGEHVKIEALTKIWPKKIRPFALIIGDLIWIAFAGFIIAYGTKLTLSLFSVGTISMALRINMGWAYAAVPVGYLLMVYRLISCVVVKEIKKIICLIKGEAIEEASTYEINETGKEDK